MNDALTAHTPNAAGDWHLLADHLSAVAATASQHADAFGGRELAHWLGLWHDAGKASEAFQSYLAACAAEPTKSHRAKSVDHKAAGSLLTIGVCDALAVLIQGHHGGLSDASELKPKVNEWRQNAALQTVIQQARTAGVIPPDRPSRLGLPAFASDRKNPRSTEFFLRMLFSALVDADHGDTERHMNPDASALRGGTPGIAELELRLTAAQENLAAAVAANGRGDDPINVLRREVYGAALTAAEHSPGFFRLTVPTGGGKTRSGLAFALRHAQRHNLRRVIVAVPYLTITEQTVDEYRKILGDDRAVLEHHSGAAERKGARDENGDESPRESWRKLAAQDWNAPVVVTTTVQLFESLFGRTPSACRKLHRLAGSVIVLDEAQSLPTTLLAPILDGLRELTANYGASVVLCTATQPEFAAAPGFADLANVREIAPDPPRLFSVLKRVEYDWRTEPWSWERVAEEMWSSDRVLTIVNTRANALALLDALGDPDALHISTLLCGSHRRDVLAIVRERLRTGEACRLVSTQVVEAGVDLDFPLVLRARGPLDRVVQAAGRCNREGRLPERGRVVVFNPEQGGLPGSSYRIGTEITDLLLKMGTLDPDNPATFSDYFRRLFTLADVDGPRIQSLREQLAYESVAESFKMIADDTVSVFVRYTGMEKDRVGIPGSDSEHAHEQITTRLADDLRLAAAGRARPGLARDLMRRAQPYLLSIRHREVAGAAREGAATELFDGFWLWEGGYDSVRGITLMKSPEELYIG